MSPALSAAAGPAVEVAGLRKTYGEVVAVAELSFQLPRGATVALLGANGAGKTTTIAMLLGLLAPTAGTIRIFGLPMPARRYRAWPRTLKAHLRGTTFAKGSLL